MGMLGCGCGAMAALFALLGLLPLLGWLNWFTTLPAALLAVIFSALSLRRDEQRGIASLGLIAGVVLLAWSLFRLSIGGGFL